MQVVKELESFQKFKTKFARQAIWVYNAYLTTMQMLNRFRKVQTQCRVPGYSTTLGSNLDDATVGYTIFKVCSSFLSDS